MSIVKYDFLREGYNLRMNLDPSNPDASTPEHQLKMLLDAGGSLQRAPNWTKKNILQQKKCCGSENLIRKINVYFKTQRYL